MKKYEELYSKIKEEILSGVYAPDSKLPSKRVMSDMSGYSLITVEKTYSILEDEGYITAVERKGYFVTGLDISKKPLNRDRKIEYLKCEEPKEKNDFEYSVWNKCVRKVLNEYKEKLYQPCSGKGLPELRNAIADYLLRYRGMFAQPSDIIIGSGAQQLYEIAVAIIGRNRIYATENPCYGQIPSVYRGVGVRTLPLKMGDDGIESTELNKNFDVLHITPFNSYPTGITTSINKRYEYLKSAVEKNRFIIEDDYDSEFFLPGHPIESLYSLDSERVIYINTFSKSLSASMRMGYMIIPKSLMKKYDEILGQRACSVPVPDQYFLSEFINSGSFERHLNRRRRALLRNCR